MTPTPAPRPAALPRRAAAAGGVRPRAVIARTGGSRARTAAAVRRVGESNYGASARPPRDAHAAERERHRRATGAKPAKGEETAGEREQPHRGVFRGLGDLVNKRRTAGAVPSLEDPYRQVGTRRKSECQRREQIPQRGSSQASRSWQPGQRMGARKKGLFFRVPSKNSVSVVPCEEGVRGGQASLLPKILSFSSLRLLPDRYLADDSHDPYHASPIPSRDRHSRRS